MTATVPTGAPIRLPSAPTAALGALRVLVRAFLGGGERQPGDRRTPTMLTLDADYSMNTIRQRGLEQTVTAADLEGFFEHVWTVHPMVGADPVDRDVRFEQPIAVDALGERHTVIECSIGSSPVARVSVMDFVRAQATLVRHLDHLVRSERIGVVRASEPFYLGLIGLVLARANRIPLVVRLIANYDSSFYASGRPVHQRLFRKRWIEKRIDRFVLSRADLVAAATDDILTYALANGASRDRATVLPLGTVIEPVHLQPRSAGAGLAAAELGLAERPFVVCVTRLEPAKHPEDVVSVLAEARKKIPDLAAVIVGDGSMRADLERSARDLGVEDDAFFAGNRDQAWIADLLRSAAVFLSPLTGRALIEAALSGVAIVAYDVDWHPELVRSGDTGVLVPYRDTGGMADAVRALVTDPGEAARLGRRARSFAMEKMGPSSLVAHERRVYGELLQR